MMTRFLAILGILLIPQLAQAQYLQPEDIVNNIQPLPKSQKEADERVEKQIQGNIERHPSTLKSYDSVDESALEQPNAPAANAGSDMQTMPETDPTTVESEPSDPAGSMEELDPIAERLLRRLLQKHGGDGEMQTYYPDGSPVMHSGALHAGAPLSGTGPETVAAGLTIVAGIGLTLWKAKKMKKLVKH